MFFTKQTCIYREAVKSSTNKFFFQIPVEPVKLDSHQESIYGFSGGACSCSSTTKIRFSKILVEFSHESTPL